MSKKILKSGFYVALLRCFYVLFELLIVVILARILGAADFGVFTFMYALVRIATIPAQAGIPTLLTREIPKYLVTNQLGNVKGVIVRSTWLSIFASLLVGVLVVLAAYYMHFNEEVSVSLYAVAVLLIPVFALSNVRGGAIRGLNEVILSQVPESFVRPVLFILGIFLHIAYLEKDLNVFDVLLIFLIASLVSSLVGWLMLLKVMPDSVKEAKATFETKSWLLSLLPLSLLGGVQILNSQIGIIYLGVFSDNQSVGIYRVVNQIGLMVMFSLTVVTMTISPTISKLYSENKIKKLERIIRKSSLVTFIFGIACTVFYWTTGRYFLPLVFGDEFLLGYLAGGLICLSQVVNSLTGPSAALLNMSGKENKTIKALLLSLILSVFLHALLVPDLGLNGAAIAASISLCVYNVFLYGYSVSELKINPLPKLKWRNKK